MAPRGTRRARARARVRGKDGERMQAGTRVRPAEVRCEEPAEVQNARARRGGARAGSKLNMAREDRSESESQQAITRRARRVQGEQREDGG